MATKSRIFICLPGSIGTLTELVMLWCDASVAKFSRAPPPLIFAWRKPWASVVEHLAQDLALPPAIVEHIHLVDSIEEVMAALEGKVLPRACSPPSAQRQ